jgi:antitoxin component YwqK of YwqJK toxin-antitoxin module
VKYHLNSQRISYLCEQDGAYEIHRAWDFNGVLIFEEEDSLGNFGAITIFDFYPNGQLRQAIVKPANSEDEYRLVKVWSEQGKLIRSEHIHNGEVETMIELKYTRPQVHQPEPEIITSNSPKVEDVETEEPNSPAAQLPELKIFSMEELKVQKRLLKIYLKQKEGQK